MQHLVIEHHHYIHGDPANDDLMASLQRQIDRLKRGDRTMTVQLDALTAEVSRNRSADDSARVLIEGLVERVSAMEPTQAAIDELVADLRGSTDTLVNAVTANTPAAPTTEPAPPSTPAPSPPAPPTDTSGGAGTTSGDTTGSGNTTGEITPPSDGSGDSAPEPR